MSLEIELSEPHEQMLKALRESAQTNPDDDLRQMVEKAIHDGYQQLQAEQEGTQNN